MKTIVWTKFGPPQVRQLKEVEKLTPKNNEVFIQIKKKLDLFIELFMELITY